MKFRAKKNVDKYSGKNKNFTFKDCDGNICGPWTVEVTGDGIEFSKYLHADGSISDVCCDDTGTKFPGWFRTRKAAREAIKLAKMPTYIVKKVVTNIETYTVKGNSRIEAIKTVLDGGGKFEGSKYFTDDEDSGMTTHYFSLDEVSLLGDATKKRKYNSFIPTIFNVELA